MRKTFIVIASFVIPFLVSGCKDQKSPLLSGGNTWSPKQGCTLDVPSGWIVEDHPIPIAVMKSSGVSDRDRIGAQTTVTTPSAFLFLPKEAFTGETWQGRLKFEAMTEAMPALEMHPSTVKQLFSGSGMLGSHPAGWAAIEFDVPQLGRRTNLVYALGNITQNERAVFYVSFFLVPANKFDQLRPTFETIAATCSAREGG